MEFPTVDVEVLPPSVKLPVEAYLYFPKDTEIKQGEGKKTIRKIFEGQVVYDQFEMNMIMTMKALFEEKKILVKRYFLYLAILISLVLKILIC